MVLAGAITAAGVFGMAAPAQAAPDRNCYSGYFCVWAGANFSTSHPMYRISYEYGSNHNWASWLPEIYHADSAWRNLRSEKWLVCDYGLVNDTKTIVLSRGQEIGYSSSANDRGEGNELYTDNQC
ncbi:hypothetical protein AB0M36_36925 [Actinoplanes sp. NPDC051346]|uniref:hypothetical protein n=1 Tax=Actinoplanes sp. NPDC051346 TaxID=3155048 RepID=UPI0034424671